MIKRALSGIAIISFFAIIGIAIVLPFLASIALDGAKKCAAGYNWGLADKKIALALRLDPLSAENYTAAGRLYAAAASMIKDSAPLLLKAESKYIRAYQLNPHDTVTLVELAALEKELFLADPVVYKDRLVRAVGFYRGSFNADPNNYLVNFEIGQNLIELWKYLDDKDKDFALERFKSCLELVPWYSEQVNDVLLYNFGNEAWKCRKKVFGVSAPKKRTADGSAWTGKSDGGNDVYENGNMYWTGTVSRTIGLPEGASVVKIKARGEAARGVWPCMIVEIDGSEIGETYVDSSEWKEYEFKADSGGGVKVLSVTFTNDGGDPKRGKDRNLYVGEVEARKDE
jgi:tetratricopeptide (TPR) repeat protein